MPGSYRQQIPRTEDSINLTLSKAQRISDGRYGRGPERNPGAWLAKSIKESWEAPEDYEPLEERQAAKKELEAEEAAKKSAEANGFDSRYYGVLTKGDNFVSCAGLIWEW